MYILSHIQIALGRWLIPLIAALSAVAIPAAPVWSVGSIETAAVIDTWYFRGTPNNWGTTLMERVDDSNVFKTCQTFSGVQNPRFKICHFQDWGECYPSQDRSVSDGAQEIVFSADTHDITVSVVPNCSSQDSWFFRGTPNDWGTTPMEQVDNSDVFKITVNVARQDPEPHNPRFKIDHFNAWCE